MITEGKIASFRNPAAPSSAVDRLGVPRIVSFLDPARRSVFNDIDVLVEVDSTNSWLLARCKQGKKPPSVCLAECQARGRGRSGRIWQSPAEANIYMSISWLFECPLDKLSTLGLLCGVAIVRCLEKIGIRGALKWPNDVFVDGRKIAGVLVEVAYSSRTDSCLVIGLGVNYDMPVGEAIAIDQPWTDIVSMCNKPIDGGRNRIAAMLITECMQVCEDMTAGKTQALLEEWRDYDLTRNRAIELVTAGCKTIKGVAKGIDKQGRLCVLVNGKIKTFTSADISLKVKEPLIHS